MIFYQSDVYISLALLSIPAIAGGYFHFIQKKQGIGLLLLLYSAFALRILMISLDPYLHEWDERFHALVAKNMMDFPFKPMMFRQHIMSFNMEDWGYNHIWVHKQPLFLWQAALSMKIFGVCTFAFRLPSVIMGTIMVWLIYDMTRMWLRNHDIAFIAAFITAFAYYPLEMISGSVSLDHNDLAFTFYVTCSFWALLKYTRSDNKVKWAIMIGVFAGMAILNKWLTGLLVFGGWGVYVLLTSYRTQVRAYIDIGLGILAAILVFVPWQLYIMYRFPQESAISYATNRKHMTEDLGHPGDAFTHLKFLSTSYGYVVIAFFALGLIYLLWKKKPSRPFTLTAMAMIIVIFTFFSLLVATKMPALVYPVSSLVIIIAAAGIYGSTRYAVYSLVKYPQPVWKASLLFIVALINVYSTFKPSDIAQNRRQDNAFRNNKIINNTFYKQLDTNILGDRVVLNCRPYENIELMFYKDCIAYHWYPPAETIDSLKRSGYHFAAFDYPGDPQQLPEWIKADTSIRILPYMLR